MQNDLHRTHTSHHSGYTFFISMCVLWELNPQPFALLTQCSTTEPQEHDKCKATFLLLKLYVQKI